MQICETAVAYLQLLGISAFPYLRSLRNRMRNFWIGRLTTELTTKKPRCSQLHLAGTATYRANRNVSHGSWQDRLYLGKSGFPKSVAFLNLSCIQIYRTNFAFKNNNILCKVIVISLEPNLAVGMWVDAKMAHDSPAVGWVFSVMPLLQDQRSPFSVLCFRSRWQSTILIHERVVIFCRFSLVGDLACSPTGKKPDLWFFFFFWFRPRRADLSRSVALLRFVLRLKCHLLELWDFSGI